MNGYLLELLAMLLVILVAAEGFTNALEHLGQRLSISEGVTGSLFAAVGTALPETLVPVLAIVAGSKDEALNEEIGVGSILGAPLMLSTLSTGLMALAVLRQRGLSGRIRPEPGGLGRDLHFFIFAFLLAAGAMYVPQAQRGVRYLLSMALVVTYLLYIVQTMRASQGLVASGHGTVAENRMFATRIGLPVNSGTILLQLAVSLALLVYGARGFIDGVQGVAHELQVSALLLSLLIIPVATELPEKVNSILWVRRGKDTMALGNITGAMVFQGTLLPAIGILLTPWEPRIEVLSSVLVTLGAAIWVRLNMRPRGLAIWALLLNVVLYVVYLAITLRR